MLRRGVVTPAIEDDEDDTFLSSEATIGFSSTSDLDLYEGSLTNDVR